MKDLTKGSIPKNLLIYAIPAILSILLTRTYSTVDSIMVGKLIGENGLAAIGSTTSFTTTLSSLLWGAGTGIGIYVGSLINANKKELSVRAIKSNLLFLFIVSISISAHAIMIYNPIFKLLIVKDEIYKDALTYYIIILISQFAVTINSCVNDIFYMTGNSSHPFRTSLFNCLANVTLNYLFIAVFKLGVLGAAIATLISALLVFSYNVFVIIKLCRKLYPIKTPFKIYRKDIASAWKLAVPCMLQQGLMYISSAIVQPIVNGISISATAAYSVCLRLYDICTIFFYSVSKGLSSLCSQCYGNGKVNLLKRGFATSLGIALVFSLPLAIFMIIFPRIVASCFLQDTTGLTANYIVRYITLCFPFVVLPILNNLYHNFFRGVLRPTIAMITTSIYSVTRITLSYVLTPSLAMDGIFLGFILSWATEVIVCTIIFISSVWKTPKFKEMEQSLNTNK